MLLVVGCPGPFSNQRTKQALYQACLDQGVGSLEITQGLYNALPSEVQAELRGWRYSGYVCPDGQGLLVADDWGSGQWEFTWRALELERTVFGWRFVRPGLRRRTFGASGHL